MKNISEFVSENVQFLVVKFSIYLNRRVFLMSNSFETCTDYLYHHRNQPYSKMKKISKISLEKRDI